MSLSGRAYVHPPTPHGPLQARRRIIYLRHLMLSHETTLRLALHRLNLPSFLDSSFNDLGNERVRDGLRQRELQISFRSRVSGNEQPQRLVTYRRIEANVLFMCRKIDEDSAKKVCRHAIADSLLGRGRGVAYCSADRFQDGSHLRRR
jgi:hypothetical protein